MEKTNLKAHCWYRCTRDIPERFFSKNHVYKCNLDGYLMNDATNNIKISSEEYDYFLQETNPDSKVNHMPYYEEGRKYSPFDVIIDWQLDFFTGNVLKYIARLGRKYDVSLSPIEKSIEDIDKALVYLNKEKELLMAELEKEQGQLSIKFE